MKKFEKHCVSVKLIPKAVSANLRHQLAAGMALDGTKLRFFFFNCSEVSAQKSFHLFFRLQQNRLNIFLADKNNYQNIC
jgi:hypothetical protein